MSEARAEPHAEEPDSGKETKDLVKNDPAVKTEFDEGEGSRLKKRKCALFLVYLGHNYQGMQRNPGVKSIEDELFKAMYKAGAISEHNAAEEKAYQKIHWSRSARTDKGVSAICQVVSTMFIAPDGIVGLINSHLPEDIRLLGYNRTVKGFDARKSCDRRRYEYIFPEWMFDPRLTPTTNNELNELSPEEFAKRRDPNYVFDDAALEKLNAILAQYEGTHNFHNYTIRVPATSGQANRYMLSFECNGVIEIGDERWVSMVVVGQSFMLHQIRKMVGMALSVFRGIVPESALKWALKSRERYGVPMAPSLGLFLDKCYFESYNKQWERMHGALDSDVSYGDEIRAFKLNRLYPSLVERDRAEGCNAAWLQELYSKRQAYFNKYPGFVSEDWDNTYQAEVAKGEGEEDGNGRPPNGDDLKRKPTETRNEPRPHTTPQPIRKKRLIDISGEYSD